MNNFTVTQQYQVVPNKDVADEDVMSQDSRENFEVWAAAHGYEISNDNEWVSVPVAVVKEVEERQKALVNALEGLCNCIMETRGTDAHNALTEAHRVLELFGKGVSI